MTLGVVVTAIKKQVSKRSGSEFARLTVEDFSGSSEVLVFPEAWAMLGDRIQARYPGAVQGRLLASATRRWTTRRSSSSRLRRSRNCARREMWRWRSSSPPARTVAADVMDDVREMVEAHAGSAPLELRWNDGNGTSARLRSRSLKIAVTNAALPRASRAAWRGARPTRPRELMHEHVDNGVRETDRRAGEADRRAEEDGRASASSAWTTRSRRSSASSTSCGARVHGTSRRCSACRSRATRRRPFTLDYICSSPSPISSSCTAIALFRDDAAIVGGWARLDGETVMVIGHQRGRDTKENLKRNFGMPHPEGYRKALRLMKLAEKFQVPVLTLIDTPGAWAGLGAEERGQSRSDRAQSVRDEPARRCRSSRP